MIYYETGKTYFEMEGKRVRKFGVKVQEKGEKQCCGEMEEKK